MSTVAALIVTAIVLRGLLAWRERRVTQWANVTHEEGTP